MSRSQMPKHLRGRNLEGQNKNKSRKHWRILQPTGGEEYQRISIQEQARRGAVPTTTPTERKHEEEQSRWPFSETGNISKGDKGWPYSRTWNMKCGMSLLRNRHKRRSGPSDPPYEQRHKEERPQQTTSGTDTKSSGPGGPHRGTDTWRGGAQSTLLRNRNVKRSGPSDTP